MSTRSRTGRRVPPAARSRPLTSSFSRIGLGFSFGLAAAIIVTAFLIGGSSRADLPTLVLLRPFAVIALGLAFARVRLEDLQGARFVLVMALLIVALPLAQLVPLPPGLWQQLPGRAVFSANDRLAGLGDLWRPVSLTPVATWNSVFSLAVPMAMLIAGLRLNGAERARMLPVVLSIALFSALFGLAQVVFKIDGLFFYPRSDVGSAIGLLANRNHQATLIAIAFPILATFASTGDQGSQWRRWAALAITITLVPLLLITGSRMGLVVGITGMAAGALLYRPAKPAASPLRRWALPAGFSLLAIALAVLTILLGRAEAFDRVLNFDAADDFRFRSWHWVALLAQTHFPVGTGFGGFVEVYRMVEPRELLGPKYFNQAHNDWLETVMAGGLPGLMLLVVAVFAWLKRAITLWQSRAIARSTERLAALGLAIMLLFAVASITDYPLRVPSLACLFVVAVVWALPRRQPLATRANSGYEQFQGRAPASRFSGQAN